MSLKIKSNIFYIDPKIRMWYKFFKWLEAVYDALIMDSLFDPKRITFYSGSLVDKQNYFKRDLWNFREIMWWTKPSQNKKDKKISRCTFFSVFSQLPAVEKDTKNGAPWNFFCPYYFSMALA